MHTGEFINILFDIPLRKRLTRPFLSFVYVLFLVAAAFHALVIVWWGFSSGVGPALASFFLAPLAFLLYAVFARVAVEMLLAILRIAESTSALAAKVNGAEADER